MKVAMVLVIMVPGGDCSGDESGGFSYSYDGCLVALVMTVVVIMMWWQW